MVPGTYGKTLVKEWFGFMLVHSWSPYIDIIPLLLIVRYTVLPPLYAVPPQLRGLLAADFSSQKFLVKRGKPEFSSLRSIVLILNRPPVEQ